MPIMAVQTEQLRLAVRPKVVLKYFGGFAFVIALLTTAPLAVSLGAGEYPVGFRYAIVIAGLAGLGVLLNRFPSPARVQYNEVMVLVALLFIFTPLVMSYPVMAAGIPFVDALFETVSGCTTTGLSTLGAVENRPVSFLFARAWMQWYGGLGIVILSLALLVRPGLVAKDLAVAESVPDDDLIGGTRAHARRILAVYLAITASGILLLLLFRADPFSAVVYALASVSTGGFSPHDGGMAALGPWPVQGAVILLCLAGSTPLVYYHRLFRSRGRLKVLSIQFLAIFFLSLAVSGFLAFFMERLPGVPLSDSLRQASLLAFSAQTTAGFSPLDASGLDNPSKVLLMVSMFFGGGASSTAGGLKILRLLIILALLRWFVVRICLPRHAVHHATVAGRRLEHGETVEALLLLFLFLSAIFLSWLAFVGFGHEPLDALFEVTSAVGTVGLSVGITRADLAPVLKLVLCADMLLGRLEIIPWLVLLYPGSWLGRRAAI